MNNNNKGLLPNSINPLKSNFRRIIIKININIKNKDNKYKDYRYKYVI